MPESDKTPEYHMKKVLNIPGNLLLKSTFFLLVSVTALLLLGNGLNTLQHLISHDEAYTHLAIIPLVSGFFLFIGRKQFQSGKGNRITGSILVLCSALYALVMNTVQWNDQIIAVSLKSIGVIMTIYGAFIFCFGLRAFQKMLFPFVFLLLSIPIPFQMLNAIIGFLQWGSAAMVDGLFTVLGQIYVREGTSFHLGTISISIAPECSGIRSTMALVITGVVAAEMFLKTWWSKAYILLLIVPLSLLKNAIRIVTITLLAEYVDTSFLTDSFLHSGGGIVFYIIVLGIYFPLLFMAARFEKKHLLLKTGSQ